MLYVVLNKKNPKTCINEYLIFDTVKETYTELIGDHDKLVDHIGHNIYDVVTDFEIRKMNLLNFKKEN
jgi:hypothetical protein